MLYHLAQLLLPHVGPFNVLTYFTVRAGGAAFTAFLICIVWGPWAIRMLRSLKIGQYIKKDHVADLHELHKGKSGTPTMGGVMILGATLVAVLLWSTLDNRLVWLAMGVFLTLGGVGFLDDYIKLKRKHNDGLSARAKFAGQMLAGFMLGGYLYLNPIAISAGHLQDAGVPDWQAFAIELAAGAEQPADTPAGLIWSRLDEADKVLLQEVSHARRISSEDRADIRRMLRTEMNEPDFYDAKAWPPETLNSEAAGLFANRDSLSTLEQVRFHRLLLEQAFPDSIPPTQANRHTSIGVPGFKAWFLPLGAFYVLVVVFIITATSNSVNLTDGLDGLAAGTGMISIFTFSAIAYVVSRADWSSYLYVTYVPEASELFVFGAALLGAGLGFLWYNSHPAEVFMGDTGSLALGGAIASLAIMTKQELLLPIVGALFVAETTSVMIQVAYFKATGKRFFRMAPIHHHFELLGWSETKVTMRFWIIAFLCALMSLATLKLR
ncbi:MAG: phospho-N-acetylmuramoyl-pentapeptide-transferase [Candidatus Hydrogenedens sp.]|nr:phospho-N-acetylmuramoyl-pentapeptide-transferase [Candidatus Hydrogenedens sp.]